MQCEAITSGSVASVAILTLAAAGVAFAVLSQTLCRRRLVTWVAVMRLAWPRFRQSFAIIVSNFQIISSVTDVSGIKFPDGFMNVANAFGKMVNLEVLNLLGLACLVGESYFRKFSAAMLMPLILVGLVKAASILHVRRIRARLAIAAGTKAARSYKLKIHRTFAVSHVSAHYAALM